MIAENSRTITMLAHGEITSYLAGRGPEGVFARYVARSTPDGRSSVRLLDGVPCGILIGGRDHGLFETYAHWIFAETEDAARSLAVLLSTDDLALNYPMELEAGILEALGPGAPVPTRDRLYLARDGASLEPSARMRRLDGGVLRELGIADELRPMLGRLDDWSMSQHLFGLVEHGELLAIAESSVRDGRFGAIQQVYTLVDRRGTGLARELVAHVASMVKQEGLVPLYLVAERNIPSIRTVEGLGFELHSTWGCIESQSGEE